MYFRKNLLTLLGKNARKKVPTDALERASEISLVSVLQRERLAQYAVLGGARVVLLCVSPALPC